MLIYRKIPIKVTADHDVFYEQGRLNAVVGVPGPTGLHARVGHGRLWGCDSQGQSRTSVTCKRLRACGCGEAGFT